MKIIFSGKTFYIQRNAFVRLKFLVLLILLFVNVALLSVFFGNNLEKEKKKSNLELIAKKEPEWPGPVDVVKEKERWKNEIEKLGAGQAYADLKKEYTDKHFWTQHAVAHIFGGLLYSYEGLDGVLVCDNSFAFGCYHSFFSTAIANEGMDSIHKLDKLCVEKYGQLGLGCQHGIGHGLIEYLGPGRLVEALDACDSLIYKGPLFSCFGGVFMEYNSPIVIEDDKWNTQRRELNKDKPYLPCTDIPKKFRQACYYEQTQLWDKVFAADYEKIGQLCDGVADDNERNVCFQGIGNIVAPSTNYEVAESINRCSKMPSKGTEVICRSGAGWSFFASETHKAEAPFLCEGLSEEDKRTCVQEANAIIPK